MAAARAFARKATYGVTVGALVTGCGLISGIAALAAGGALATGASVVAAQAKYADDRRDIELSDMYFLVRAAIHAP